MFWGIFSACSWAATLYFLTRDPALIQRRLRGGPTAEQTYRERIIQTINGLLFIGVLAVAGLDHHHRWSQAPTSIVLSSDLMVLLGFGLMCLALRENSYAAATITTEAGQQVISTGPYRFVRHPMYAGAALLLLGAPLALGSIAALPISVLLCFGIVARLLDEERYLSANLPGYKAYREKVH